MRLHILFVIGLFLALCAPVRAEADMAVYQVADIIVDVTSGNASIARDLAIVQAQRQAFGVLMERLGAKDQVGKTGDDQIASLVQALEIQKEHAAGVRYNATYAIQFKPDAVRNFLSHKNISYVEVRSSPLVVLPVVRSKGRNILWEEVTPWHTAWLDAAKRAGLVPVIVPQAEADDVAKVGAEEALAGKAENLQQIMRKYEATGVLVAVFTGDFDVIDGKTETTLDLYRYDMNGKAGETSQSKIPAFTSAKAIPEALDVVVRRTIGQLERGYRQSNKAPTGPTSFLPVDVAVPTLSAWSQIRNKLRNVSSVADAHVVTMTRGLVHAEIEFRGEILAMQQAMAQQGLILEQNVGGGWDLRVDGAQQSQGY